MSTRRTHFDQAERLALIAISRREGILAINRHTLPRTDLEDCHSQATVELLAGLKRGAVFVSDTHMANVFEQRVLSRIRDRRRALRGRSPIEAALAVALPLTDGGAGGVEIRDGRAETERIVFSRHELRRLRLAFCVLTRDQRLVLASQLFCGERDPLFGAQGWSLEKYRKVGQRARARLRASLVADKEICQ